MVGTRQDYPGQNQEANEFLNRVAGLPSGPVSLDDVLQPSLDDEVELRKLFAQDKSNARLVDQHVGLVDVFAAPADIRKTRARVVKDDADLSAKYVMPLPATRRRAEGAPAMVDDLDEFRKNWAIFTEGALSQLADWSNVVAAGGSVLACLTPIPELAKGSKRNMRKYFHEAAFPTSDIDLFLWGMTPQQAEDKIRAIYEAVRDSVPWDVTCVRTKHTVSIHSQYPYRSIQIVLRLYQSPAEILLGFDVDAPCCLYDGQHVYASPRAIVAMMRQCNTVDMTRRSPSYEVRLAKYSIRGFEVYIPNLRRADIDPTVFERSINRIQGLGRLLVLEKLSDPESRVKYLNDRSTLRGRPLVADYYYRRQSRQARKYGGDLKSHAAFSGLEMNDYDVVSLHIPYGPGWTSGRIEKLIYKTDLGMNTPYNPKNENRRLHRHPAFFGSIEHCLEDCCEFCPEPRNKEEHELQDEEDKVYVRGRIAFVEQDPGRQSMSGSFNPIDEGEWSEQAYVQAVAKFFSAICMGDRVAVTQMIEDGEDVNRRDYVGRTALHYALLCGQWDIAMDLIDAGARMTARLPGGRSALHLAAQFGQPAVIRKMLERSAANEEKEKEKETQKEKERKEEEGAMEVEDDERPSSEDDWSSQDAEKSDDEEEKQGEPKDDTNVLDDNEEEPDILDVTMADWDYSFSPLAYAIIAGSVESVEVLLSAGADAKTTMRTRFNQAYHPLSMTMFTEDDARASEIVTRLLASGVTSSISDSLATEFHRFVTAGKTKLVSTVLRRDANAKVVMDHPASLNWDITHPVTTAIDAGDYATTAVLLAHGAKIFFTEEDVSKALDARKNAWNGNASYHWQSKVYLPVEVALARHDYIVQTLAALGANVDFMIKRYAQSDPQHQYTVLDWTRKALDHYDPSKYLKKNGEEKKERPMAAPTGDSWSEYRAYLQSWEANYFAPDTEDTKTNATDLARIHSYLLEIEPVLVEHGAKPNPTPAAEPAKPAAVPTPPKASGYSRHSVYLRSELVPLHLKAMYDELYEACWNGDNARIEELCLPKHPSKSDTPLQISVQTVTAKNDRSGHTPLSVAVHRKKWDTARLILAIASAQYFPDEPAEWFDVNELVGDEEGDNDSDVDMDDDTQADVQYTDIADRPSAVHCKARPNRMIRNVESLWIGKDGEAHNTTLTERAIREDDFEAFVNLCDLCPTVDEKLWPSSCILPWVLEHDRPEMLDELIRRTGCSINVPVDMKKDEDGDGKAGGNSNSKERVYLGLNIQGKKRKDLATRRTNTREARYPPLLHDAVRANADKVIDYLATARPVEAFRYYSSTHSDPRAELLRRTHDLEIVLPMWIGWEVNDLNESALTAAIKDGEDLFSIVQQLFEKQPQLMLEAMNAEIKFVGVNALTLAAYSGCNADCDCHTDMLDFFLAKGCDATLRDARGWNIYHLTVMSNIDKRRARTMAHLLKVLPADMTSGLMLQQSKEALNTPLMLAAKRGRNITVQTMLKHGLEPSVFLLRDAKGSIPLHIAVQNSNEAMARLLIEYGPPESLFIENGVGQTPVDIAVQKRLSALQLHSCWGAVITPQLLTVPIYTRGRVHFQLSEQEVQVPKLRAALEALFREGQLKQGTKLATELSVFTGKMEAKLAVAQAEAAQRAADEADEPEVDPGSPPADPFATATVVRDAFARRRGHRQLVHLLDVQKSVQTNLERFAGREDPEEVLQQKMKHTDGFAPEPEERDAAELQNPQQMVTLPAKDQW